MSKLLIQIDRTDGEWVEFIKCAHCDYYPTGMQCCPHGPHTRAAWVEGMVGIDCWGNGEYECAMQMGTVPVEIGIHNVRRQFITCLCTDSQSAAREITQQLIAALRANTLPDALMQSADNPDGLRVCMESACKLIDHDVDDKLRELSRRRRPHWRGRAGEQFEEGESCSPTLEGQKQVKQEPQP